MKSFVVLSAAVLLALSLTIHHSQNKTSPFEASAQANDSEVLANE